MPEEVAKKTSVSGDSKVVLVLQVNSVDESYLALQKKGCRFLTLPKDMADWGIRVAHLQDPEGNLLEIFSYLPKEKWSEQLLSQTPAS